MKSIINAQPPSISIFSRSDVKPLFSSIKLLWLSNKSYRRDEEAAGSAFLEMHDRNRKVRRSFSVRVGSDALFLAATTAPKSADISVLLPTSGVMLFVYWIANFVLPELIMKDLQAGETNEDENSLDGQEGRSPEQVKRMQSSGPEKRGFGRTKK